MRKIRIDWGRAHRAISRDTDFVPYPETAYLDLHTGDIEWVYDDDQHAEAEIGMSVDENREKRLMVEGDPERYVALPELAHGDHHELLQGFLNSDWTSDRALRERARRAYQGSFGGWKKAIGYDDDILTAWREYKNERLDEIIVQSLRERGIEVEWT